MVPRAAGRTTDLRDLRFDLSEHPLPSAHCHNLLSHRENTCLNCAASHYHTQIPLSSVYVWFPVLQTIIQIRPPPGTLLFLIVPLNLIFRKT